MEVGHLPAVSPDPVVFPSLDNISGRASYPMIKAHGKVKQFSEETCCIFWFSNSERWKQTYKTIPNN